MSGQRSAGRHSSSKGSSRDEKAGGSGSSARTGATSTEQLEGRPPSGEPDVDNPDLVNRIF